jgi:predicted PurR-regulated permease PerM
MSGLSVPSGRGSVIALWIIAGAAVLWWLRAASQLLIPIAIAACISYALERQWSPG